MLNSMNFYLLAGVFVVWTMPAVARPAIEAGAVATGAPEATEAAIEVLREGGNAIDAAVAAGLTLGVVDGHNSGIGGGCFILIYLADGEVIAIDGRETAPAAATRAMYLREGKPGTELSRKGALAVGVPGALAAYDLALRNYGSFPLRVLLEPAADLAEKGFEIDEQYAKRLLEHADDLRDYLPEDAPFFLADSTLKEGALLEQPDLAKTYRSIAEEGTGWFYGGPFAELVEEWMKSHGGILTANDFRSYRVLVREPVQSIYRGYQIYSFPPPSSGGVHVIQILNMLEKFDVAAMKTDPVRFAHLAAEAMKLAFADRAHWLGDPGFGLVPTEGLIDKEYAAERAKIITENSVTAVKGHGFPPGISKSEDSKKTRGLDKHTTHFSVADASGNWVVVTATINTPFGAKVMVPGTGVFLNNEMDDFSVQPGVPNYFGLVGGEANAIEPGKRPLSSMSPTIVTKNGEPVIALGAAGGPTIITQTVLNLVRMVDFQFTAEKALFLGRFHHQWLPDVLQVESQIPVEERQELEKLGHKIEVVHAIGASQIVTTLPDGTLRAASDPRITGASVVE